MAGLNLTAIPASRRGSRTPLEEIDETLRETVEEAFVYCSADKDGSRLETPPFASKDAAKSWLSDARAYAYRREAGRVVVEGNPSQAYDENDKKLPGQYVVRFRVVPFVAAS